MYIKYFRHNRYEIYILYPIILLHLKKRKENLKLHLCKHKYILLILVLVHTCIL